MGCFRQFLVGSEVCRLAGPATVQAQEMNNMDVWVMDSADRAFESSVKGENAETKVVLYAARNEYEAAQVLVRSSENLNGVYLEASDLVGENGEKIQGPARSVFSGNTVMKQRFRGKWRRRRMEVIAIRMHCSIMRRWMCQQT